MRGRALLLLFIFGVTAASAGTVPIDGGVPVVAPDGPAVNVTGSTNISLDNASATFPDANTVHINTTADDATYSSPGDTQVTVAATAMEGPWTNVSGLQVSGTRLTIDPADKLRASVKGGTTAFRFRESIALDDDTVDFSYTASSSTAITVRGLPAGERIAAVDQNGDRLGTTTTTASGAAMFSSLAASEHHVRLVTTDGTVDTSPTDAISPEPITRRALVVLFLLALMGSYLVLSKPVTAQPVFRVLGGAFMVVMWVALAFWWTEYVIVDMTTATLTRSNQPLSLLSLLAGIVHLLDVIRSGFVLIGD